jgi:hypothetical protein
VYPEVAETANESGYRERKVLYHNLRNGKFADVSAEGGPGILETVPARGCAFGDFDNDGDVDILIMNLNEPPSLLRNDMRGNDHSIKVKLIGTKSNRSAIGARVTAHYGGKVQAQEVLSQASFYSVNDPRLHFGLGAVDKVDLDVRWPNGGMERFTKVSADRIVTIREGAGIIKAEPFAKRSKLSA